MVVVVARGRSGDRCGESAVESLRVRCLYSTDTRPSDSTDPVVSSCVGVVMWCRVVFRIVCFVRNLAPAIEPSRGIEAGRSCNPVAHPRQELFMKKR